MPDSPGTVWILSNTRNGSAIPSCRTAKRPTDDRATALETAPSCFTAGVSTPG